MSQPHEIVPWDPMGPTQHPAVLHASSSLHRFHTPFMDLGEVDANNVHVVPSFHRLSSL